MRELNKLFIESKSSIDMFFFFYSSGTLIFSPHLLILRSAAVQIKKNKQKTKTNKKTPAN